MSIEAKSWKINERARLTNKQTGKKGLKKNTSFIQTETNNQK